MKRLRASALALFASLGCSLGVHAGEEGVRVMLDTAAGSIDVEVFPQRAPLSACDFLP